MLICHYLRNGNRISIKIVLNGAILAPNNKEITNTDYQ